MGFSVYLKGDKTPVKIDAERVDANAEVLIFFNDATDQAVAVIPVVNLWYIVKDQA